jgi:hypothetical protein
MVTYKITNITNLVGKREIKYNSILDIEYIDSMMKKTIKVNPGDTVYLKISSLPLSVHRLRVKKLVSVVEINDSELKKTMDAAKPPVIKTEIEEPVKKVLPKKKEIKPEIKKVQDLGKISNDYEISNVE